jgi:hypothetical protein
MRKLAFVAEKSPFGRRKPAHYTGKSGPVEEATKKRRTSDGQATNKQCQCVAAQSGLFFPADCFISLFFCPRGGICAMPDMPAIAARGVGSG